MTSHIQATLPELQSLSRQLGTCSSDVEDLQSRLSALINGTDWQGSAATRFRNSWESQFRPALREMATALTDASGEVNNRMNRLISADS